MLPSRFRLCCLLLLLALPFNYALGQSSSELAMSHGSIPLSAQNPYVYLPSLSKPQQMDSIYGARPNQRMGEKLVNIGPRPGSSYGTIVSMQEDLNRSQLLSFDGGPNLDLHSTSFGKRLNFHISAEHWVVGHFRDTYHNDLFVMTTGGFSRIYWEDEQGDFDSLRVTKFMTDLDGVHGGGYSRIGFCAHLTSDTVYDIVYEAHTYRGSPLEDTAYISLVHGGAQLYQPGDTILADETVNFGAATNSDGSDLARYCYEVNLEPGRTSILGFDTKNLFYYKLSRPFQLSDFAKAIRFDTLFAGEHLINIRQNDYVAVPIRMPVFVKSPGDSSMDLVHYVHKRTKFEDAVYLFKGGEDFGTKRLTLETADYIIPSPFYNDSMHFAGGNFYSVTDCGDMAGRGNHFLCIQEAIPILETEYCFYELGTELDDKMDVYFADGPGYRGYVDTITANGDKLQDVVIGIPGRYDYGNTDKLAYGSIQILYGSSAIPRRNASTVRSKALGASFSISPAVLHQHEKLHVTRHRSFDADAIIVRDILGREVYRAACPLAGTDFHLTLPDLAASTYLIGLASQSNAEFTRLVVVK